MKLKMTIARTTQMMKWTRTAAALATLILTLQGTALAIVTNNEETSDNDPSTYTLLGHTGFDWDGVGSGGAKSVVAVDPYWVISAKHAELSIGGTVWIDGTSYTIEDKVDNPGSDLSLMQVDKAIPTYYDIYTGSLDMSGSERTQVLLVGTGKAGSKTDNTTYNADVGDRERRWGTNMTDSTATTTPGTFGTTDVIVAGFNLVDLGGNNPDTTLYESGVCDNDSGGGMFVYNVSTGKYELVGIHITVTGSLTAATGSVSADLQKYTTWIDNVIPEPATISLLALGGIALIRRRRRA
jgi:hypothetical protein